MIFVEVSKIIQPKGPQKMRFENLNISILRDEVKRRARKGEEENF
jgi:hypothetical protein